MLHRLYLAKGAQATTAIEGNPLTVEEVQRHLNGQLQLPLSQEYHGVEIDNVVGACQRIEELIRLGDDQMTLQRICELNSSVLKNLPLEQGVVPGQIRSHSVTVGNVYRGAPAEDCEFLVSQLCSWLDGPDFSATAGNEIVYGIIKAVIAHLYLAWIHPFGDGNGRTARMVEFQVLLSAGIPTPAAHLLSNHYNHTRRDYYRNLDIASKSGGDILPFLEYAVRGFVDGLREQISLIRKQQWDVTWESYVYEVFRDMRSPQETRQRMLALDLGTTDQSVSFTELRNLSVRIAREYGAKTDRTIRRDVTALESLGLVVRDQDGVRARKEIVQAFLPWRKR